MSDLITLPRATVQQALEALDWYAECAMVSDKASDAASALRAALEQPEQKPVAWKDRTYGNLHHQDFGNSIPLYTHPPRREWRGLTDEQLLYVYNELPNWGMDMDSLSPKLKQFARAVEAALKGRNA